MLVRNGIFTDWTELPDQTEEKVRGMMPFEAGRVPFEVGATLQASSQWAYDPLSDSKSAKQILSNLMMIVAKVRGAKAARSSESDERSEPTRAE